MDELLHDFMTKVYPQGLHIALHLVEATRNVVNDYWEGIC